MQRIEIESMLFTVSSALGQNNTDAQSIYKSNTRQLRIEALYTAIPIICFFTLALVPFGVIKLIRFVVQYKQKQKKNVERDERNRRLTEAKILERKFAFEESARNILATSIPATPRSEHTPKSLKSMYKKYSDFTEEREASEKCNVKVNEQELQNFYKEDETFKKENEDLRTLSKFRISLWLVVLVYFAHIIRSGITMNSLFNFLNDMDKSNSGYYYPICIAVHYSVLLVVSPIIGNWSYHRSFRQTYLFRLIMESFGYLIFFAASTPWMHVISQIFFGLADGGTNAANTYITNTTPPKFRPFFFIMVELAHTLGGLIGTGLLTAISLIPPVTISADSGVTLSLHKYRYIAIFSYLLCVVSILLVVFLLRERKKRIPLWIKYCTKRPNKEGKLGIGQQFIKTKQSLLGCLAGASILPVFAILVMHMINEVSEIVVETMCTVMISDFFDWGLSETGIVYLYIAVMSTIGIIFLSFAGWMLNKKLVLFLTTIFTIIGFALEIRYTKVFYVWQHIVALAIINLCLMIINLFTQTISARNAGICLGLFTSGTCVAYLIGSMIALIYNVAGSLVAFLVVIGLFVVSGFLQLVSCYFIRDNTETETATSDDASIEGELEKPAIVSDTPHQQHNAFA